MSTSSKHFDAVVVGSGFGGATVALRLTQAGARVAMIERGGWPVRDEQDWDPRSILLDKRYKSESPVAVDLYGFGRPDDYPNETVGGMSVFYGGASLRLRERDFDRWPIDYPDLAPYYDEAENLLGVHGQADGDPVGPPRQQPYPASPIELTFPAERIQNAARSLGHHPFPIPTAINFSDETRPTCVLCATCDGYPCKIEAKNDLPATILKQAQEHGLKIFAQTTAARFERSGARVSGLACIDGTTDTQTTFTADTFVLSAGALHSPAILLRSRFDHPSVGRYLMRHCNVIVACVFPFRTNPGRTFHKQTCITDFYEQQRDETGMAVGVIQDIYTPDPIVMKAHAPRWGRGVIGLTHRYMQNLLCVAEDDPQASNRVELTDRRDRHGLEVPRVTHDYTEADKVRSNVLAQGAKAILQEAGGRFPYRYLIDTFSHAVGSVRMGTDEADCPLDLDCRYRGVNNLYVSDGSFMPTSGGVNPSLTIAANGLRVGSRIVELTE
ncbi:TPA: hypothetical protein DCE37_23780 [Candidatus Latescibacteria bacterium]|nr:hypothetical protein [Candidatus Latescibacterota bacterium]